jgi:hypothetical protein
MKKYFILLSFLCLSSTSSFALPKVISMEFTFGFGVTIQGPGGKYESCAPAFSICNWTIITGMATNPDMGHQLIYDKEIKTLTIKLKKSLLPPDDITNYLSTSTFDMVNNNPEKGFKLSNEIKESLDISANFILDNSYPITDDGEYFLITITNLN